jgi:hypothetical protein
VLVLRSGHLDLAALRNGARLDLAVARDLMGRGVVVIVNLSAGRARLLQQAEVLLEPCDRAELAALLPRDGHGLLELVPEPVGADRSPP